MSVAQLQSITNQGSGLQCSESLLEMKGTHTLERCEASRQHSASSEGFVIIRLCPGEKYLRRGTKEESCVWAWALRELCCCWGPVVGLM